eukprot:5089830-Pleurochrysis_carterae.AAC.1
MCLLLRGCWCVSLMRVESSVAHACGAVYGFFRASVSPLAHATFFRSAGSLAPPRAASFAETLFPCLDRRRRARPAGRAPGGRGMHAGRPGGGRRPHR